MVDSQRAKFVQVSELMKQVAEGIGVGQRTLVTAAQTAHGTLSVKTADVTVEFVLSNTATAAGLAVPGVGANTLFGIGVTQEQQTSKATISLQIVPIFPAIDARPATADAADTSVVLPGPGVPGLPAPSVLIQIVKSFQETVDRLLAAAQADRSLSKTEKATISSELAKIRGMADRDSLGKAADALRAFSETYKTWLARQKEA
jgi:hypothetical protein